MKLMLRVAGFFQLSCPQLKVGIKHFAKICENKEPKGDGLTNKYSLTRSSPHSHIKVSTGKRVQSIF